MDASELKSLKVKTGTVRRLRKELAMYEQEQRSEAEKVERLKSQGADPHDIKYAENILAESAAMIPDTRQRLEQAGQQLEAALEQAGDETGPEIEAGKEELDKLKADEATA